MHRKSKDLLGLPVMDISEGKMVGKVRQVIFFPRERRIAGFVVGGNLLQDKVAVSFDDVLSLGDDAVTIGGATGVRKLAHMPELQKLLRSKVQLFNSTIMTVTGRDLGVVDEIVVSDDGTITHLVVSEGIFQDFMRGDRAVLAECVRAIGEDAVIVTDDAEIVAIERPERRPKTSRKPTKPLPVVSDSLEEAPEEEEASPEPENPPPGNEKENKLKQWFSRVRHFSKAAPEVSETNAAEKAASPQPEDAVESKVDAARETAAPEDRDTDIMMPSVEAAAKESDASVDRADRETPPSEIAPESSSRPLPHSPKPENLANVSDDDAKELEAAWTGTVIKAKDVSELVSRKVVYLRIEDKEEAEKKTFTRDVKGQLKHIWEQWQPKIESVKQGIDDKSGDYLVGKTVERSIYDSGGQPIIGQGEMISQDVVERAKEAGRLYHLALSAAVKDVDETMQNLRRKFASKSSD